MRILLLNDDALPAARGGAAVIVEGLRRAFTALGHTVLLVTTHQDRGSGAVVRRSDDAGEVVSIFRRYPLKERHRRCLFDADMSRTLASIFDDFKPDAVHAHNVHTYLTYDALRVAKRFTDRIVLTAHDTFLVSFDRVRERRPLKLHFWHHLADAGRKYWPLRNPTIKKILRESDVTVVGISEAVAAFLCANDIPCATVIPNGIEVGRAPDAQSVRAFRDKLNLHGPTILFAGRIREDKGIDVLLDHLAAILKDMPNAQLLVAGERSQLEPHLASRAAAVRAAVVATDWFPRGDMPLVYAAADVVATPSLYLDNFPTVNLEAMAAGKPVVATCLGGTPEAVRDGVTGFIRHPRSPAFAEALVRLLRTPDVARMMGDAGRKRAEELFSLRGQAERYLKVFQAAL